jgi:hypothetical protein
LDAATNPNTAAKRATRKEARIFFPKLREYILYLLGVSVYKRKGGKNERPERVRSYVNDMGRESFAIGSLCLSPLQPADYIKNKEIRHLEKSQHELICTRCDSGAGCPR